MKTSNGIPPVNCWNVKDIYLLRLRYAKFNLLIHAHRAAATSAFRFALYGRGLVSSAPSRMVGLNSRVLNGFKLIVVCVLFVPVKRRCSFVVHVYAPEAYGDLWRNISYVKRTMLWLLVIPRPKVDVLGDKIAYWRPTFTPANLTDYGEGLAPICSDRKLLLANKNFSGN